MRRARRSAYTLIEILLSLLISVLLMAALSSAVGYQLRLSQAGRDVVNETALSRAVLARIENDVIASASLVDPGRFRNQQRQQSGGMTGMGATATTPATGTTPPTTGTGTGTGTGGTATPAEPESADSTTDGSTDPAAQTGPVVLPLAVIGDSTTLTIFASKVPGEVYGVRPGEPGQLVSDIRRICYWMADGGAGLCRQEIRIATANDALAAQLPTGDAQNYLIAPEVKSIEFSYFDGTGWVESWDSTAPGDGDGITPVGSPRAIEVRIGILPPGATDESEMKYHRHVIAIPTANGVTQATNGDGVTPP
jgi:hypothetical protein